MLKENLKNIIQRLGYQYEGPEEVYITGVEFDSRQIKPGDLFLAIEGEQVDGHRFIEAAHQNGALAAVVTKDVAVPQGMAKITADDILSFISALAKDIRSQFQGPVIAITGSQGKTSTKELLASVIGRDEHLVVTAENQNNELGLPYTLTKINEDTNTVIVEMGMTGFGEIKALAEIAQPTHGIITTIGTVHAELLGSQEGIARAKTELFSYLPATGACIMREADKKWVQPYLQELKAQPIWCSGEAGTLADWRAEDIIINSDGIQYTACSDREKIAITSPLSGQHFVENTLLVVALAKTLNLNNQSIQNGLAHPQMMATSRMEKIITAGNRLLINDAYNANPASVIATLNVLATYKNRPKAALLGNMYELGPYEESGHQAVGEKAAAVPLDYLFCYGGLAKIIGQAAIDAGLSPERVFYVENPEEAMQAVGANLPEDGVLLIKGSNSLRLFELAEQLRDAWGKNI